MSSGTGVPWWSNSGEVHQFGEVLVDAGVLEDAHAVLDYFEKPRNWRAEYEGWITTGRPTSYEDAGWEEFCDGC